MSRLIVLIAVLLLPFQSAWSGNVLGCSAGVVRVAQAVQALGDDASGQQQALTGDCCADPNCASCHAPAAALIATHVGVGGLAIGIALPAPIPAVVFGSAWARAPDRPNWLRLV